MRLSIFGGSILQFGSTTEYPFYFYIYVSLWIETSRNGWKLQVVFRDRPNFFATGLAALTSCLGSFDRVWS